jgi:glutamyl-tRNA(Gln) amidotransferase subunit D
MYSEELKCYQDFDGLIIEGTGLGHGQTIKGDDKSEENETIKKELAMLAKKIPVAMTVQTIYGRVNMNVYSPGRELIEMGIIGNYCDMTPETGFIKLAWLLSNYKKSEVKDLYEKNLRGEISERTEKENFLN